MSETTTADPGTWIRGITIRQPWTTCILAGKDVENRPAHWLMGSSAVIRGV
ncbi:hypothetical protein QF032_008022 [Streptomyces achromogenes]|uniref:Uncharacterized protein n=1 Tax=Streptomyces achromogenes TaxID=67255 RepID=A0ABU0PRS8_STRAH|nr:hypothetical protein [Streptomyces achromogenes]MDQ0681079.1 hypothetical protein [Streptomyces achromogenes]MDQ0836178.1 hypothetical protein [Streptomyces achromogenes]